MKPKELILSILVISMIVFSWVWSDKKVAMERAAQADPVNAIATNTQYATPRPVPMVEVVTGPTDNPRFTADPQFKADFTGFILLAPENSNDLLNFPIREALSLSLTGACPNCEFRAWTITFPTNSMDKLLRMALEKPSMVDALKRFIAQQRILEMTNSARFGADNVSPLTNSERIPK